MNDSSSGQSEHPVRSQYRHVKCGNVTDIDMERALTFAHCPWFYKRAWCDACKDHFYTREGENWGFCWTDGGSPVGATAAEEAKWRAEHPEAEPPTMEVIARTVPETFFVENGGAEGVIAAGGDGGGDFSSENEENSAAATENEGAAAENDGEDNWIGRFSDADVEKMARAAAIYQRTVMENPYIRKDLLKDGRPHPRQTDFLMQTETSEVFYGGSAAGGKSYALLMAALQYVEVPGYSAIILRNSFRDLNQPEALIPVSKTWLLNYGGTKWNARDRRWTFPSGATLTFGYLERPDDALQYRGAAFQFCVAPETPVLMGDGSYKQMGEITVGDRVMTLEGPRSVTRTHKLIYEQAIKIKITDCSGHLLAEQTQSASHRLLGPTGWVVASCKPFVSSPPNVSESTGCHICRKCLQSLTQKPHNGQQHPAYHNLDRAQEYEQPPQLHHDSIQSALSMSQVCVQPDNCAHAPYDYAQPIQCYCACRYSSESWSKCQSAAPLPDNQFPDLSPTNALSPQLLDHQSEPAFSSSSIDNQNGGAKCYDLRQDTRQPPGWCGLVMLHAPSLRSIASCCERKATSCDNDDAPISSSTPDCQKHCWYGCDLCDEHAHGSPKACRHDLQQPNGVEAYNPTYYNENAKEQILAHSLQQQEYVHPYKMDKRQSDNPLAFGSCSVTPCGKMFLCDITVEDTSHYITKSGLINANCGFDELTLFDEESYLYLFSRLRKTKNLDVPLRMRSASNPGGKGAAWVRERFILPSTRKKEVLFIPAKIDDNPSLSREEYEKNLRHLDPVTRRQLMDGDWEASQDGRFKMAWFKNGRFKHDPFNRAFQLCDQERDYGGPIALNRCTLFVIVDLAVSVKTHSDYTVFMLCALTPGGQLLILDVERKKYPVDQIPYALKKFCDRAKNTYDYWPVWCGIEANGMQVALANACRQQEGMIPVRYLRPANADKLARANKAIIMAEQGQIFLPISAGWLDDFLYELIVFTGDPKKDSHDDQVDCLSYASASIADVAFESPSFAGRAKDQGRDTYADRGRMVARDGMTRVWNRDGRMRRLFGN